MFETPDWPYFLGAPSAEGNIRSCPEDFVVEEISRVQPEGEGNHLWLWVEKRSANTDWVAKEIARVAGCVPRDVGYAGLKDRHAITTQWFSVPITPTTQKSLESAEIEGVNILESSYHSRKLKRGTLEGNRFKLRIRQVTHDDGQTAGRLERIRADGVPNYFGPQRFGHRGQNVERGFQALQQRARIPRNKRSMYLSAIRSFLFNQVLAERVRRGNWNTIIGGDLAMLDGTRSIFPCENPGTDIEDRTRRLDVHPTGPMPGEKGTQPTGTVAELEQEVLQHWPQLIEVLKAQRVQASRRALRLYPADLEWSIDDGGLVLNFVLPPGTYATAVLREILICSDVARSQDLNNVG